MSPAERVLVQNMRCETRSTERIHLFELRDSQQELLENILFSIVLN